MANGQPLDHRAKVSIHFDFKTRRLCGFAFFPHENFPVNGWDRQLFYFLNSMLSIELIVF